jgi:hypothetical protein
MFSVWFPFLYWCQDGNLGSSTCLLLIEYSRVWRYAQPNLEKVEIPWQTGWYWASLWAGRSQSIRKKVQRSATWIARPPAQSTFHTLNIGLIYVRDHHHQSYWVCLPKNIVILGINKHWASSNKNKKKKEGIPRGCFWWKWEKSIGLKNHSGLSPSILQRVCRYKIFCDIGHNYWYSSYNIKK